MSRRHIPRDIERVCPERLVRVFAKCWRVLIARFGIGIDLRVGHVMAKRRSAQVDDFVLLERVERGIIRAHRRHWLRVQPVAMVGNVLVGATAGAVILHRMRQNHLLPGKVDGRMMPARIVVATASARARTAGRAWSRVITGVAAKLSTNRRVPTRQTRPTATFTVIIVGGVLFGVVGACNP